MDTNSKLSKGSFAAIFLGYHFNDAPIWEVVKVGRFDGELVEVRFVDGEWFPIPANQLNHVWLADMSGFIRHGYESPEFP